MAKKSRSTPKGKNRLDIKEVLENLDKRNMGFYANLSEEDKKAFEPYVVMRFASAVSDRAGFLSQYFYLRGTNDLVNRYFSELNKHPELQWLLLSLVGLGVKQYHVWVPPGRRGSASSKVEMLLQERFPLANDDEIQLLRQINGRDDIVELARRMGYQDKEIEAIEAELDR